MGVNTTRTIKEPLHMQEVVDTGYPKNNTEVIRPFGPSIVKMTIPEQVGYDLTDLFDRNSEASDHSMNLAGNMKREFTIDQTVLDDTAAQGFVQMLADGSAELYKVSRWVAWENTKRTAVEKHVEIVDSRINDMNLSCAVHQAWGNISVAGDFNPVHTHTGAISGVGYLHLPDDIESEWEREDHDPSAGMINFLHGAHQGLNGHSLRLKPEVGAIYFFPAWLQHEVYPFRSAGERWSFSFNTTVTNLNNDIELTDLDKIEILEARNAKS